MPSANREPTNSGEERYLAFLSDELRGVRTDIKGLNDKLIGLEMGFQSLKLAFDNHEKQNNAQRKEDKNKEGRWQIFWLDLLKWAITAGIAAVVAAYFAAINS